METQFKQHTLEDTHQKESASGNEDSDGYESFYDYWMDNQIEPRGEISNNLSLAYEGDVEITMHGETIVVTEILPSVSEAIEVAKMAANPNCGGYQKIVLNESRKKPTYMSARAWLLNE